MVFKKAPFGPHFSFKKLLFVFPPNYAERPFRDPAFHEHRVILVPLGPSVFKNIIFSMMIGYFSVLFAFRCAMFCVTVALLGHVRG
jgi:hypothetical protein